MIGLGLLGSALADRFEQDGFAVTGYDADASRCRGAQSAADIAQQCRTIVLSLPTSAIASRVIEALPLSPGTLVIDTTTGEPAEMEAMAHRLGTAGVRYLDATVGGSSRVVSKGDAIVMVGGDASDYEAALPLLRCFARQTFHLGPCGAGARMKLAMNLVLGLNRAVLAEGLTFARALGVDPAVALEVLKAGPAYSRAMDAKGEKMLAADFTPEARLSQHLKDVRIILQEAAARQAPVPLSTVHRDLLAHAEALGFGQADNCAVIRAYDEAPQAPTQASLFLDYSVRKLRQHCERIEQCLGRLTDEQVWMRGSGNENAAGNLVLHLCGNVRQWIISGAGGAPDTRERDAEFAARGGLAREELLARLRSTVEEAAEVITALPPHRLTEFITPQGYRVSVTECVYHVTEHFAGHAGQILFLTKALTGEDLGFHRHLSITGKLGAGDPQTP